MIEQVKIFGGRTDDAGWSEAMSERINAFLAKKNEQGEHKDITRVFHETAPDRDFLFITIFYQWVKGEPDFGPFRTAPKGE